MWIFSIIFDWLGIGVITIALGVGAILAFMRGWSHVALGLAIIAGAHFYSGTLYQMGEAACQKRVQAAIKEEQDRQAGVTAAAVAASEARADAAESIAAEKEEEIAAYISEIEKLSDSACVLNPDDVTRLRSILR